jgi:preprotein translocase subunit SecY
MLAVVLPQLSSIKKEGESGRRKLTQYTRYGTVLLAAVQGSSAALAFQNQGVVIAPGLRFVFVATVTLTAGTMFLMWLGEQITERGLGNGISMIILAGIVAGLPVAVINTFSAVNEGSMSVISLIINALEVAAFTYFVVFVESGQRRITVNYARRQGGRNAYMNQTSFLPLKLNMSGVIPPIFASSILAFPATLALWSGQSTSTVWLQRASQALAPGEPLHMIVLAALIIGFAFFYTALVFNSQETADNLKKSGALIPGIRPGKATADYVDAVLTRLTAIGSMYLVAVCLLPDIMRTQLGASFYFGGTSLLIVVVVVMDFIAQVQAHLMSHQYEGLLKKANLKGGSRGGMARS